MAINWQEVFTTIGSTAVVVSAFAFLTKSVINHFLARDVEKFKALLQANADMEIEKLKNSLQMVAHEHQVRFSKLHEKRAEVIADLHARLVDAERDGSRFITVEAWDDDTRREAYNATHKKIVGLYYFVEKNRIYLPEPVCELLASFVEEVRKGMIGMNTYAPFEPSANPRHNETRVSVVTHVYESFQGTIPAARKVLESEFRKMLGAEHHGAEGQSL
jgi:hypothetical protein